MLTRADLANLEQALRGRTVLSIYINGEIADVAARGQWRIKLRNALDDIETSLANAPHAEREDFAATRRMVGEQVDGYAPGPGAPGWMGFFSAGAAHHAGATSVAVPTVATWARGANLAPCLRVLKEARPVLVVVADSGHVRIHRYADRTLAPVDTIDREVQIDTPYYMSRPPRPGFHSGTRGRSGADAAQRDQRKGTEVLLSEAADRIEQLADDDAWVVLGGIPSVASALRARLSPKVADRATESPIDVHATDAQLAEAARASASGLRMAHDLDRIARSVSAASAHGNGATGVPDTERALANGQVKEVYLTTDFVHDRPEMADALVKRAFQEGAVVEHVSGEAAARLDAVGGIAALLRYAERRVTVPSV